MSFMPHPPPGSAGGSRLTVQLKADNPELLATRLTGVKFLLARRNLAIADVETFFEGGSYVAYANIVGQSESVTKFQAGQIPRLQAFIRRFLLHHKAWKVFIAPDLELLQSCLRRVMLQRELRLVKRSVISILSMSRRVLAGAQFILILQEEERKAKEKAAEEERNRLLALEEMEKQSAESKLRAEQERLAQLEAAEKARQEQERMEREERERKEKEQAVSLLQAILRRIDANICYCALLKDLWLAEAAVEAERARLRAEALKRAQEEMEKNKVVEPVEEEEEEVVPKAKILAAARKARQSAEEDLKLMKCRINHLQHLTENSLRRATRAEQQTQQNLTVRSQVFERQEMKRRAQAERQRELEANRYQNIVKEWKRRQVIVERQEKMSLQKRRDASLQRELTQVLLSEQEYQRHIRINTAKALAQHARSKMKKSKLSQEEEDSARISSLTLHYDHSLEREQDMMSKTMEEMQEIAKQEELLLQVLASARDKELTTHKKLLTASE